MVTFRVGPHPKKKGYTLIPSEPVGYLPEGRMGWYKFKRDACSRAAALNANGRAEEYANGLNKEAS